MNNAQSHETETMQSGILVNRNYKAGVFTHLFGEPKNELDLYNAFSPIRYPPGTPVIDLTLTDVLFMDRVNDLSFCIDGKLVVFFEHTSTINENMPLRYLTYCGRVYEKLFDNKAIYSRHRMPVPTPEFYVLYNGELPFPEKMVYHLSDAFIQQPSGEKPLELVVTAYNVNKGFNDDIIKRSDNLQGYVTLVSKVRENEHNGMTRAMAVKQAVRDCMAEGVLTEYLKNNASEVSNMLTNEWDWDAARAVWKEEDKAEGMAEGKAVGMAEGKAEGISSEKVNTAKRMLGLGMSVELIATATELAVDEIIRLQTSSSLVSEDATAYK